MFPWDDVNNKYWCLVHHLIPEAWLECWFWGVRSFLDYFFVIPVRKKKEKYKYTHTHTEKYPYLHSYSWCLCTNTGIQLPSFDSPQRKIYWSVYRNVYVLWCVCVCVCIHIRIYTHIHICIHIYEYVCIHCRVC